MQPVSNRFLNELRQPVTQFRVKLEVLDNDGNPVDGGTFNDVGYTGDATNILVDGAVDLDVTRPARRTFTATLLNKDGEWSPSSNWSGLFYVDRNIRIWRGLVYSDGVDELVPCGTFLIDHADVVVERNMSVVNLAGTDRWKKLTKSLFTTPQTFVAGTGLNDVIESVISGAGISDWTLDSLASRVTETNSLNVDIPVEAGDSRSSMLQQLGTDYGLDLAFDPMGVFTSKDLQSPASQAIVFRFYGS